MGVRGLTVDNDIIVKAVIEVGKFVGIEGFNKDNARQFLDCLCAVIGKYLDDNPKNAFHLNKYIVSKNNKSKFNLFTVHIFRQDKEVRTPTDMYNYYLRGGRFLKAFKKTLKEFAENLILEATEDEEKDNQVIEKLAKMRKLTKTRQAKRAKKRKLKKQKKPKK